MKSKVLHSVVQTTLRKQISFRSNKFVMPLQEES